MNSPAASSSKLPVSYPEDDNDGPGHEEKGDTVTDEEIEMEMDDEEFENQAAIRPIAKPLTAEALAAFEAAQSRAGIVYISRIPPAMRPAKVRHLMSGFGELGRVYLQQEGVQIFSRLLRYAL